MGGKAKSTKATGLLSLDVPRLRHEQIDLFARGLIYDQPVMAFDTSQAVENIKKSKGLELIGIDIGGDKYFQTAYEASEHSLKPTGSSTKIHSPPGEGYVTQMEKTAERAASNSTPVGLSIGLRLNGTKPEKHFGNKLPALRKDLAEKHQNDFSKLFSGSQFTCLNDGPAGLVCGAVHAENIFNRPIENVIFLINGGGIGAAVLTKKTIYTTEAGQVPLARELQSYSDHRPPHGIEGKKYLSIENAAGNKAGIEYYWQRETGTERSAIEIEKQFTEHKQKASFALELYDYSAIIVAHAACGLAQAFEIDITSKNTAVICHGGAFKFPHYGDRVVQIIESGLGAKIQLACTKDFSDNACAEGAAIAALHQAS